MQINLPRKGIKVGYFLIGGALTGAGIGIFFAPEGVHFREDSRRFFLGLAQSLALGLREDLPLWRGETQIPFGDDNKESNSKEKSRSTLA